MAGELVADAVVVDDDEVEVGVGVEGGTRKERSNNEADPVYSVPRTVAFDPLAGGELFGPEKALMSAPVRMEMGFAARRGMGAMVCSGWCEGVGVGEGEG